ncbi:MAG: hypothetical protein IKP22_11130 [Clostridia bacterium]|nr:hypothetical protein [Clostridia bacterium]
MKKTVALILAAMMLLCAAAASADALFAPKNRSDLAGLPALPSGIPECKVKHDEKTNTYTVTVSENPVWACANLWYNGKGNVDGITFNGNTASFKGTKAQIGLWWIGGPYSSSDGEYLNWWMQKGEEEGQFADEEAALAFGAEEYPGYDSYKLEEIYRWDVNVNEYDADGNWVGYIGGYYWADPADYGYDQAAFEAAALAEYQAMYPDKILRCNDFASVLRAWKLLGISNRTWMAYAGDDALLIGYQNMNVWYTRGGIPTRVTVNMNEDPFQTGKKLSSASVTYMRDGKYSGHWYVSNVEVSYADDPVAKVSVDYNDTMAGSWLRYSVTLSSGGTLNYTR